MTHSKSFLVALRIGLLSNALWVFAPALLAQQPAITQHYTQTNLVADTSGIAAVTDPNLVNPWGIARSSTGAWWVSDNNSGLSTLYSGTGAIVPLVVTIPTAEPNSGTGSPTGIVFNGTTGFQIAAGKAAAFLFVTEDGTISGWNPAVSPTAAVVKVNTHQASVFKGATIASLDVPYAGRQDFLYVADFRKGHVAVFNSNFQRVPWIEGLFCDDRLPYGYAPFNVQNIGGNLYVTYALQDSAKHDEIDGAGLGYVDVFSPSGRLLQRLESGSWFNAPWGLAQASGDFGQYSHDILVGQFGSGEILVFNSVDGHFKGRLRNAQDAPIAIQGLWGLAFGNGSSAGPATTLYFTAGSDQEQHGLFGSIVPVENSLGNDE